MGQKNNGYPYPGRVNLSYAVKDAQMALHTGDPSDQECLNHKRKILVLIIQPTVFIFWVAFQQNAKH